MTTESNGGQGGGCLLWIVTIALAVALVYIPDVGPVLALITLCVGWAVHRWMRKSRAAASPPAPVPGSPSATPAPAKVSAERSSGPVESITKEREAASKRGAAYVDMRVRTTRLSSNGRRGVAGEYYHAKEIARFVGRRRLAPAGEWDAGLRTSAYLLREPANRHDRNAVQVLLPHGDSTVLAGYLPASEAPEWQPLLRRLEDAGRIAECAAQVYRDGDGYQVVLHLADPEDAELANAEPDNATLLPAGRQCAVTGEKEHQDVLEPYRDGALVWATLHRATVPRGKYAGSETIEVRIDGSPVGLLTAAQGERYAEVLTWGEVVACEARVYQGANYLEVQLMLPKVD